MRLQSIVTSCPVDGTEALCVRRAADGSLKFDTYFNILYLGLWRKYTTARHFRLSLTAEGMGKLRLVGDGRLLCEKAVSEGGQIIEFDGEGASCVWLETTSGVNVASGAFEADTEAVNNVKIALNICTYRREEYVRRNIACIRSAIWQNPNSQLRDNLSAFISDNAGTLGDIPGASVFVNRNVGGSGGFARGMLEIMRDGWATHLVFMDDDVALMPESLERLYAFLCVLRPEYTSVPIGGAMLRLDRPCTQHESLARWHGLLSESLKSGLELSDLKCILENTREEKADYSAWWFSCVPLSLARGKGLPLPIFVRMDDVEYGIRLGANPIALPGVCVWHEPFDRKHSAGAEYYHARNSLIVNAVRTPENDSVRLLFHLIVGALMRYRYKHVRMILKGIEDYLKGPEFIMALDPQACNMQLERLDMQKVSGDDCAHLLQSGKVTDTSASKLFSALTLNGAIFPAGGRAYVNAHINPVRAYYRKAEALNIIADTGSGFTVRRDNREAIKLLREALTLLRKLRKDGPMVAHQWQEAEKRLTSAEFWGEYLKLNWD